MPSVAFHVPGRLDTKTGGYIYDRRIIAGLRGRGWTVSVRELDGSFPFPTPAARRDAASALAEIPDAEIVVVDGLAFGVLPVEAAREATRLRLVALVHHPLAAETGYSPDVARALHASEARALEAASLVVVTSRATARALKDYGVDADRIVWVEPGTDRAPIASGSRDRTRQLLSVAALVPRKGHETLVRALAAISARAWRLTCVGSLERDHATVASLRALLDETGLGDRVSLVGEADGPALDAFYDAADIFVLPTQYEGFGMAVAEALARGLPVIATPTGAIPELVGPHAGLLVPPGDVVALAAALERVLGDRGLLDRLAAGARQVRDDLADWDVATDKIADALRRLEHDGLVQR